MSEGHERYEAELMRLAAFLETRHLIAECKSIGLLEAVDAAIELIEHPGIDAALLDVASQLDAKAGEANEEYIATRLSRCSGEAVGYMHSAAIVRVNAMKYMRIDETITSEE